MTITALRRTLRGVFILLISLLVACDQSLASSIDKSIRNYTDMILFSDYIGIIKITDRKPVYFGASDAIKTCGWVYSADVISNLKGAPKESKTAITFFIGEGTAFYGYDKKYVVMARYHDPKAILRTRVPEEEIGDVKADYVREEIC